MSDNFQRIGKTWVFLRDNYSPNKLYYKTIGTSYSVFYFNRNNCYVTPLLSGPDLTEFNTTYKLTATELTEIYNPSFHRVVKITGGDELHEADIKDFFGEKRLLVDATANNDSVATIGELRRDKMKTKFDYDLSSRNVLGTNELTLFNASGVGYINLIQVQIDKPDEYNLRLYIDGILELDILIEDVKTVLKRDNPDKHDKSLYLLDGEKTIIMKSGRGYRFNTSFDVKVYNKDVLTNKVKAHLIEYMVE